MSKSHESTQRSELLRQIHDQIHRGSLSGVRRQLSSLASTPLTPTERVKVAEMALLVGMPTLTLRLLQKRVRGRQAKLTPPKDREKAIYAYALSDMGAQQEAAQLLSSISPDNEPRALMFNAYVHFRLHDCAAMLPLLKSALASPQLEPADARIAKIRMATAYSYGINGKQDFERADQLLQEALAGFEPEQSQRVHWLAHLASTQLRLLQGDTDRAHALVQQMERLFPDEEGLAYSTFIRWLKVLVDLRATQGSPQSHEAIESFKQSVQGTTHTELARQCDFLRAIWSGDRELAMRLYYGSPFAGLRADIERYTGVGYNTLPSHYDWVVPPAPGVGPQSGDPIVLNALDGSHGPAPSKLKAGHARQRLLYALVADAYIAPNNCILSHAIYPGEFFNPDSTPAKINQLMRRLRLWFKRHRIPVQVVERDGFYALQSTSRVPVVVRVDRAMVAPDCQSPQAFRHADALGKLSSAFGTQRFATPDVCKLLGIGRSSVQELLGELISEQSVVAHGQGRARRYTLKGVSAAT